MTKPCITTTDALRSAATAINCAAEALGNIGGDVHQIAEMKAIGDFMLTGAGREDEGNQSCRLDLSF